MRSIIFTTNNKGKVTEIKELLASLDLKVYIPIDLGLTLDVVEAGQTYVENGTKKAVAFAQISGLIALGDDSGLEVDGIDGQPGLNFHRYCPIPNMTDPDRRKYLLEQLVDKPRPWTAYFRAIVAIASISGNIKLVTGQCKGEIIPDERGANDFGYDPILLIRELWRTMAELEMDEKNHLSHQARAIQNAIPILNEVLGQ
jgi:XTP/dITP diphosphohydrolase